MTPRPATSSVVPLHPSQRPPTSMGRPGTALALAYEGSMVSEGTDVIPFVIEPSSGSIPAGKKASITVTFSPVDINEFDAKLVCR